MKDLDYYIKLLNINYIPLSIISPGNDEKAVSVEDALKLVELFKKDKVKILGGEIMTIKNNEIDYAIYAWGSKFIYLDWYCQKNSNESEEEFLIRSYDITIQSILNANKVAVDRESPVYINITIQ